MSVWQACRLFFFAFLFAPFSRWVFSSKIFSSQHVLRPLFAIRTPPVSSWASVPALVVTHFQFIVCVHRLNVFRASLLVVMKHVGSSAGSFRMLSWGRQCCPCFFFTVFARFSKRFSLLRLCGLSQARSGVRARWCGLLWRTEKIGEGSSCDICSPCRASSEMERYLDDVQRFCLLSVASCEKSEQFGCRFRPQSRSHHVRSWRSTFHTVCTRHVANCLPLLFQLVYHHVSDRETDETHGRLFFCGFGHLTPPSFLRRKHIVLSFVFLSSLMLLGFLQ